MSRRTTSLPHLLCILGTGAALGCGAPSDDAPAAAMAAARTIPGDLGQPYDQISSDSLWKTGEDLYYVTTDTQARKCATGQCMAQIMAVANQKFDSLNIGPNGTIVARLMNYGRRQTGANAGVERVYQFGHTPDDQKVYYLIAYGSGSGWRWTVREAARGNMALAAETASGSWTTCKHKPGNSPSHPKAKSKFWKCDETVVAGTVRDPELDPGWLDCSAGCCTAGQ
jgi:hypothetical protein